MQWYPAPAKLNLFLHVLGRRADGYHLLQSVFRMIDRCDRVGIAPRTDGVLRRVVEVPGVPEEADLCLRAAHALRARARETLGPAASRLGADLSLDKVLPLGGGLGGGSSDAATVLRVLNRLWATRLAPQELAALALALGADVPFFVLGENALGEGVGEVLRPLALPPAWYLVLEPQVTVSTKEIFADPALTRNTKPLKIPPFFRGLGHNDLEPVVTARYPEVAARLHWLRRQCPQARMTGSGACVFAEFETEAEAHALHSRLPETCTGFVARGLDRHPLDTAS
ncbi:MAG TPA: 4-(cytidine 5'-diphospho)-2-C-methyl-D-erythritol kinase [Burkholderiales bacterium]